MTIPADIEKKARRVYDALGRGSISDSERIARAIMEERERCAKIALRNVEFWKANPTTVIPAIGESFVRCAEGIASAIRNEGEQG